MILADTSAWIECLRGNDSELGRLLEEGRVLVHSLIIGELACGNLAPRAEFLEDIVLLPAAIEATYEETMRYLALNKLWGEGIGWIDMHLLASTHLSEARIHTRDRAVRRAAERLGILHSA